MVVNFVIFVSFLIAAATASTEASPSVIRFGRHTDIIYEISRKTFSEINIRKGFVFATNGKFLLVLNIKESCCLTIDIKTRYAVHLPTKIDFVEGDSIIYTKLLRRVNALLTKFQTISPSTSSSFNFKLLVVSFYKLQFDLSVIYKGQHELVISLSKSFGTWLSLSQKHIVQGTLQRRRSVWGFCAVLVDLDVQISFSIMEVLRTSIRHFSSIEHKIMIEFIKLIKIDVHSVLAFSTKLSDISCLTSNPSVDYVLGRVNDPKYNLLLLNMTYEETSLPVIVTKIDSKYIMHFTLQPNSVKSEYMNVLFLLDVLFIFNVNNDIAIVLHGRSFVLVNLNCNKFILGTLEPQQNIDCVVIVHPALAKQIQGRRFPQAATTIITLINKNKESSEFSFLTLREAVLSGSISQVASVVSSEQASDVLTYYGPFFQQTSGGDSIGEVATGVFIYQNISSSSNFVTVINNIANDDQDWSSFLDVSITIPLLDLKLDSLLEGVGSLLGGLLGQGSKSGKNLGGISDILNLGRSGGLLSGRK